MTRHCRNLGAWFIESVEVLHCSSWSRVTLVDIAIVKANQEGRLRPSQQEHDDPIQHQQTCVPKMVTLG